MKKTFIGIDVSMTCLDVFVNDDQSKESFVIENTKKAIARFFKRYDSEHTYVAMENTGRYNWSIYEALASFKGHVYVISPLHLKKSMGLVRGKNDKIDAIRIASFIEKNYSNTPQWKPMPLAIKKIKILLSERNLRILQKKQLDQQLASYQLFESTGLDKTLLKLNQKMVRELKFQIDAIEKELHNIIQSDETLSTQAQLVGSIPGVGKVLTWMLLSATEGFQKINEPRKFACYCGVVPFEHQSGTSIRGKTRVSLFADKKLKSILHMAAMRAIQLKNDLQQYYHRKVKEGKNKMSVLNAIRNKIIHRVFAVIKNQIPYQMTLVLS
jgi:transposase